MYKNNQGHLTVLCVVFVWPGGPTSPVRIIAQNPWFVYQNHLAVFIIPINIIGCYDFMSIVMKDRFKLLWAEYSALHPGTGKIWQISHCGMTFRQDFQGCVTSRTVNCLLRGNTRISFFKNCLTIIGRLSFVSLDNKNRNTLWPSLWIDLCPAYLVTQHRWSTVPSPRSFVKAEIWKPIWNFRESLLVSSMTRAGFRALNISPTAKWCSCK